jgi:peptide/nickel transport system substrate-binding protein
MKAAVTRPTVSRRAFIQIVTAGAALGLLQACAQPAAPAATTVPKATEAPKPAVPEVPKPVATSAPAATAAPAVATQAAAATPKKGGAFTWAHVMAAVEFNPYQLNHGHYPFIRSLWNSLAHYDEKFNMVPELAEKWQIAPDGKSVAITLRKGVKFHNGRELTADDVKATVEFASSDERAWMRPMYQGIKEVKIADNYNLTFGFAAPSPAIYEIMDMLFVMAKESIQDRSKTAIGTGPFKVERYQPNNSIEMSAFKDYWDQGKPYLDKYTARQVPDAASLGINLEAGAVDAVSQISLVDYVRLEKETARFVGYRGFSESRFDVSLNTKVKPFDNKKVRQAMNWAFDRERFCKTVLLGLAEPSCVIWPAHSWAYFKDLEGTYTFNLDKAKALLAEAGLGSGFSTEILCSTAAFGQRQIAELFAADLKKIGVEAKITAIDHAAYQNRYLTLRDFQIAAHSYGRAGRDPGSTVTGAVVWYTDREKAPSGFISDTWDKLRNDLQSTVEREKRLPICRKLQEIALDECFTLPLADSPNPLMTAKFVKNFVFDQQHSPRTDAIWLDK